MIRPARFQDVPVLLTMLHEMYAASKYLGRAKVADKAADALLMGAIAQMGQSGPQASHVVLATEGDEPVGFVIGVMDRVYHIGDMLTANDLYLYVRGGQSPKHTFALVDSYLEWARRHRKCIEIVLSWSDAIPGADRLAALYQRKGARKTGEMFEIRLDEGEREAA